MGDSIAREMSEDSIPELDVASEMELCANTMKNLVAEMRQDSIPGGEQRQILDKKMKELGMAMYLLLAIELGRILILFLFKFTQADVIDVILIIIWHGTILFTIVYSTFSFYDNVEQG